MPAAVRRSSRFEAYRVGNARNYDACPPSAWPPYVARPILSLVNLLIRSTDADLVTMYDEAYRKQPANEELGVQDFFVNVRTGNWKNAQQVRMRIDWNL